MFLHKITILSCQLTDICWLCFFQVFTFAHDRASHFVVICLMSIIYGYEQSIGILKISTTFLVCLEKVFGVKNDEMLFYCTGICVVYFHVLSALDKAYMLSWCKNINKTFRINLYTVIYFLMICEMQKIDILSPQIFLDRKPIELNDSLLEHFRMEINSIIWLILLLV